MKEETAVTYLKKLLENQPYLYRRDFEKALEMEREQIEEAFRHGELFSADYYDGKNINSQYYEITYKGGEQ